MDVRSCTAHPLFFFFLFPRPPSSTLFPYTTLFRSDLRGRLRWDAAQPSRHRSACGARARGQERCRDRSEEHTSELQSRLHLVCRLLLEKKKKKKVIYTSSKVRAR